MSDLYDKIREDVAFRKEWAEKSGLGLKNTRCSFHCNRLILGEVARPERFELPAFWFVARRSIQLS